MLGRVVDFLPSPVEVPAIKGVDVLTEKQWFARVLMRALLGTRFQDYERSIRWIVDVRAYLFWSFATAAIRSEHR